jgi:predicted PurR-regulated permease PerM
VLVVMLGLLVVVAVVGFVVVQPLVKQAQHFAGELPDYVADARAGRGPLGDLVRRYNLDEWLRNNEDTLRQYTSGLGSTGIEILRTVGDLVVASLTMFVLTVLLLLQGPKLVDGILATISPRHRDRVRHIGRDCSKAVTGYVAGNLLISVIAGVTVYAYLWATGVPFKGVLALWVGFADLIPLVGATLGAIPVVAVSFLHSVPVGIGAIVFFVVYQQFENHVLQVTVMAKTVKLNALAVLLSVLIGVELMGITGALLAIPAAGALQVIWRDLYAERQRLHLAAVPPEEVAPVGAEED